MMSSTERLSSLDALFLYLESPRTPMHMGSVAIFEGAPLKDGQGNMRMRAIRAAIEGRLDSVPKLRKRVRFPRFPGASPVWVDDAGFEIAHHVRLVDLPAPGTDAELLELSADVLAEPLDRGHPLWELWFVQGLSGGRVALIEKLHHALADGLAGVELATVLLDVERDPAPQVDAAAWHPAPQPREVTIVTRDLVHRSWQPVRAGLSVLGALRHPLLRGRPAAELVGALGTLATPRTVAPRSSINVSVGHRRSLIFVRQPLDELKSVERRFGVTINDVLLAAVAGGLRSQLMGREETVDGGTLQALVPVATDPHGDHHLGNKVSAMIVRLPVGLDDPVARLAAVARTVSSCKDHRQALAGDFIMRLLEPLPRPALIATAAVAHHQPFMNLVVTNVPGPSMPLYALGAQMLEAFPVVPLAGNLSIGVAALSYDGQLSLGLFADRDRCPDLDVLADGIRRSFSELIVAAGESGAGNPGGEANVPASTGPHPAGAAASPRRSPQRHLHSGAPVHRSAGPPAVRKKEHPSSR